MWGRCVAWIIPHLIVKSLAFVDMTLTVWYTVLMIGLSWLWMWDMEVATWFFDASIRYNNCWIKV